MKIKISLLINALSIFILVAASCKVSKQFISKRPVNDVKSILLTGIFTDVRIIVTGNRQEFDYPLSLEVYNEMSSIIKSQLPEGVQVKTIITDSVTQRNIFNAAQKIIKDIEKRKRRIKKVTIHEILIKSLDSANENFGFVILESGFARTYNNYTNHLLYNRAATFLLSMGTVEYTPYKEGSMLIGFIIDKKNKNLAYYKKIFWQQRDPIEKIVIKAQLHDLIMSYFQRAK